MNAILSLSHFCETHGPTVLFSTQAFHFAGERHAGILKPSEVQFFGCIRKLEEYNARAVNNFENVSCEACDSTCGFITNDHQSKISFLSTRLAIDSNVSSLMKQAAVRSLSCEVVPGKEGQVYFGDSVHGHILSNTFFLKDSQARGFHRWYSVLVFMRDKHLLLNSWTFFEWHIKQLVVHLQKKAAQVYSCEQKVCSQRRLRMSNASQKHSTARSLVKLIDSASIFAEVHLWFTWLLSAGAKRLEECVPTRVSSTTLLNKSMDAASKNDSLEFINEEKSIWHLRKLRQCLGTYNFQKVIYSTLIGQQVIVRGPRLFVDLIINLLRLFLPSRKFRCIGFGEKYKAPDVCNVLGLDSSAAVPKSSEKLARVDIVPNQESGNRTFTDLNEAYDFHNFFVKTESKLPEKLPSLLLKIEKCLSDGTLSNRVLRLHFSSIVQKWLHTADVIKEAKNKHGGIYCASLMQFLGVQEQDELLIKFWTS